MHTIYILLFSHSVVSDCESMDCSVPGFPVIHYLYICICIQNLFYYTWWRLEKENENREIEKQTKWNGYIEYEVEKVKQTRRK